MPLVHQIGSHQGDVRRRPAKADDAEAQKVARQLWQTNR
jgi:hypothetical protein